MSDTEEEIQTQFTITQTNPPASTTIPAVAQHISTGNDVSNNEDDNLSSASTQTDLPRLPECLTEEESNFLRFCHLVQKMAPEAVRDRFDKDKLEGIINSKRKELEQTKRITKTQRGLIFPKGSHPVSSSFDVTLMVFLFRHLTNIIPKSLNYDTLPPPSDTSLGADLARIKYYRNNISHYLEKDRKLDSHDFPIVWETVAEAIGRIGGLNYENKCLSLLTVKLDNSYQEVYKDIVNDILMREEELKQEIENLKVKHKDPLREHERDNINDILCQWESRDKLFAETRAATEIMNSISSENIVIVTGSPGSGKSFTAQHVLLYLRTKGYDILPVTSASDIVKHFCKSNQQIFYIDDLLGKCNVFKSDIEDWEKNNQRLTDIFSSCKCIFTCRLQIYQDPLFKNLPLKNCKAINLSRDHKLSVEEKKNISKQYLEQVVLERLSDDTIDSSICFPLLCSLFVKHADGDPDFFQRPEICFKDELTKMKQKPNKLKYTCIALCVMFNNNVPMEIFKSSPGIDIDRVIHGVFEELEVNVMTPKKTLQLQFQSLLDSFFKRSTSGYQSIHDYMFDIFCSHVGETMRECFINYANIQILTSRIVLQSLLKENETIEEQKMVFLRYPLWYLKYNKHIFINISLEFEDFYFLRMMKDFNNGKVVEVFDSPK